MGSRDIMNAMHNLKVTEGVQGTGTPVQVVGSPAPQQLFAPPPLQQQYQVSQPQVQQTFAPLQQQLQEPLVPKPGVWKGDAMTALKFAGGPPPRR